MHRINDILPEVLGEAINNFAEIKAKELEYKFKKRPFRLVYEKVRISRLLSHIHWHIVYSLSYGELKKNIKND